MVPRVDYEQIPLPSSGHAIVHREPVPNVFTVTTRPPPRSPSPVCVDYRDKNISTRIHGYTGGLVELPFAARAGDGGLLEGMLPFTASILTKLSKSVGDEDVPLHRPPRHLGAEAAAIWFAVYKRLRRASRIPCRSLIGDEDILVSITAMRSVL